MKFESFTAEDKFDVLPLWDDLLFVPVEGVLDCDDTRTIMESLWNTTGSQTRAVLVDVSEAPVLDTRLCKQLLDLRSAARLMDMDFLVSGVSPTETEVLEKLGIDFGDVDTHSCLDRAFNSDQRQCLGEDHWSMIVTRGEP